MPSLLDSALGWMQDPRRTQQLQGTGRAIQQGLLNIQQSDKRFQDLFDKSFGDPKQPFKVTDKKALSELTEMTQSGLLGMAEVGMLSKAVKGLSKGASIKSLDEISAKYPNVIIDASVGKKDINLSRIEVPKEIRNQGLGTQVMSDLSEYADSIGKRITLTPSGDFGGSVPKLKTFYKELGFVENKGKNKDFSTRETMYREPQSVEQSAKAEYPLAPAGTRYEEFGGKLTYMTPDEYLSKVRPLELDDVSLENIASLKSHVQSGGKLDPLHIYKDGKEDGRHRAYMAKELGIEQIPVALHTEANNLGQNIPMDALSLLAEQKRKEITSLLE
jgi:GNAT superfamily N-acetyltransferase